MRRSRSWSPRGPLLSVAALGLALVTLVPGSAVAHPEHARGGDGSKELFPGEGVITAAAKPDPGETRALEPRTTGPVELVGKGEVTNPSGAGNEGRVADVTGYQGFAYLNAFNSPTCEAGGVHVMDLADPANPAEVPEAFIPTSPGSYAGEGIQVVRMDNENFDGDLLVHQNETCDPAQIVDPTKAGGISLWDVSNPRNPQPITLHTGDFTNEAGGRDPSPNTTHSMRVWTDTFAKRTYAVLVDNEEFTDIDILDITNPRRPILINDTLDLVALFGVQQESPESLTQIFSHDMDVYRVGQRYVMTMNYWDGGYVLLDVTNPRAVEIIAESDYAALDEERLARGHGISPEGNAHQSELSPNRRFMIGTDEDFAPNRTTGMVTSGPYAGADYLAVQAGDTPTLQSGETLDGEVTFVGLGCDPATFPAGTGIALIERGVCTFQEKLDAVAAAGYSSGIVFNSAVPGCDALINMAAAGDIPFFFVSRLAGLQMLGVPGLDDADVCNTVASGEGQATTLEAVFDGWGYVRLFRTDIPRQRGQEGSINQVDTYAVPESQDPAFADGFGDLSVHEVAMDPDQQGLAYISYYAAGLRVVEYGPRGITEIGSFIDEGGSNFWGVEVYYDDDGEKYILASDRDFGLYVFQVEP